MGATHTRLILACWSGEAAVPPRDSRSAPRVHSCLCKCWDPRKTRPRWPGIDKEWAPWGSCGPACGNHEIGHFRLTSVREGASKVNPVGISRRDGSPATVNTLDGRLFPVRVVSAHDSMLIRLVEFCDVPR